MFQSLFNKLICPCCKSNHLKLCGTKFLGDEIWLGEILCEGCNRVYPIKNGIPCLLSKELLEAQNSPNMDQWIQKKKGIENYIVDEDLATFQNFYKESARKEGLSEDVDRFIWEKIMHLDNQLLRDSIGTDKASKWVITKQNIYGRNERIFNKVKKFEGSFRGRLIINIGPGIDDDLIGRLNSAGANMVNCDIIIDTLQEIKSRNKIECISADLKCMPLDQGVCDMVFCFLVLHHIKPLEQALSEIFRILKPGGKVFILEMNPYTPIKLPGMILPSGIKRFIRKIMRRYFVGVEQRIFKSTPYEKMYPTRCIMSSMCKVGFCDIAKVVASHYPPFIPKTISKIWDKLAFYLPFIFERIALEIIVYGEKPLERGNN